MNTMKWLIRREFWEHKGAFFWTPVVVAGTLLLFIVAGLIYGFANSNMGGIYIHGDKFVATGDLIGAIPEAMRSEIVRVASGSYLAFATPLFLVLPVVLFFYCLAAMYDDRRDRSILFWKSLPISDQETVLSKALTALCVVPLITIAIATVTALVILLLGATAASIKGLNLFAPLLASSNLYLSPLVLLALLPVYVAWALPTVGWLLLVSSWARSKVFLWAVGVPLLAVVIIKWFNVVVGSFSNSVIDIRWFVENIVARGLGGLFPGVWLADANAPAIVGSNNRGIDPTGLLAESWSTLAQPGVWAGVIAGIAMIYLAGRLRRWRDEG